MSLFDDLFGRPAAPEGPPLITFICIGNICRSPLGEKVLRARLDAARPGAFEVSSAGLRAVVGAGMEPEPAEIAIQQGAQTAHSAAQISADLLRRSTLVLTMTRNQRAEVAQEFPFALKRTFTLVEFTRILDELSGEVPGPDGSGRTLFDVVQDATRFRGMISLSDGDDIDDPYRRSLETHERVGNRISGLVNHLAEKITRRDSTA